MSGAQLSPRARRLAAKNASRIAVGNVDLTGSPWRQIAVGVAAVPLAIWMAVCIYNVMTSGSSVDRPATDAKCLRLMRTARNRVAVENEPLVLTLHSLRGCASRWRGYFMAWGQARQLGLCSGHSSTSP